MGGRWTGDCGTAISHDKWGLPHDGRGIKVKMHYAFLAWFMQLDFSYIVEKRKQLTLRTVSHMSRIHVSYVKNPCLVKINILRKFHHRHPQVLGRGNIYID